MKKESKGKTDFLPETKNTATSVKNLAMDTKTPMIQSTAAEGRKTERLKDSQLKLKTNTRPTLMRTLLNLRTKSWLSYFKNFKSNSNQ